MKTTLKYYLIFFICYPSIAQVNIVPNSGFEIIDTCNSAGGISLGVAPPWDSPTNGGSDDVYDTCGMFSNCSVPINGFGFQQPHSGSGYAGGVLYGGSNYREYCQVELDSTLIAGKKYCVNFYVSLANTSTCGSNNIGIYFSNTHTFLITSYMINVTPQINYDTIISDTTNWTLISSSYVALGGERYIIIGNFFSDALTDTTRIGVSPWSSYYYIDDVSIVDCTNEGILENENINQITIYPNPSTALFSIHSEGIKILQIKILNIIGEEIKTITNTTTIDLTDYPNGIYFAEIKTDKGTTNKKIILQ